MPQALRGDPLFSGAGNSKCDRKSAFASGRCAGVISMPGTLTKMLTGKYTPVTPQYHVNASSGENTTWALPGHDAADGYYWGRRAFFPGSEKVLDPATGGLVECTADLCPKAVRHSRTGKLVDRVLLCLSEPSRTLPGTLS